MRLVSDPAIATKIRRMQERVCWGSPRIAAAGIDQTRLEVADSPSGAEAFSFLVLGDSGTGRYRRSSPQRQVAERLLRHGGDAGFILHTGDVVYLVGSSEQYRRNFIRPYREWLVDGDQWRWIAYDRMRFTLPFFPVPGNHDYYDLPFPLGWISGLSQPLRFLLRPLIDLDVGWHGSRQGEAYARAFLDVLQGRGEAELAAHLTRHYPPDRRGERCLRYEPGSFTRLPNRYYSFRWAGVEIFALDSNTFNHPLPASPADPQARARLQRQRESLEQQRTRLLEGWDGGLGLLAQDTEQDPERAPEEITEQLEQLEEQILDIDKQLEPAGEAAAVDEEQLNWFTERLVASWRDPLVRGRVVTLHHPPYVTESTKWFQGQTLAVRHHLRRALDAAAAALGDRPPDRPLLDLVLTGHAHCMELLRSHDTGHADGGILWLICGGSGYSLRRQRAEGPVLLERRGDRLRPVATSDWFLGRSGRGADLRRPYTALRVDVEAGRPLRFRLTPLIAEKLRHRWHHPPPEPLDL
jgi:3',5'-cyclic AMP phosphodiesterase CpdA